MRAPIAPPTLERRTVRLKLARLVRRCRRPMPRWGWGQLRHAVLDILMLAVDVPVIQTPCHQALSAIAAHSLPVLRSSLRVASQRLRGLPDRRPGPRRTPRRARR